jgi:transcriptional regulator with XRE-family HTH domain
LPNSLHSEAYKALVERLIKARLAAKLTQQAVADRLGKPQSYVAKVEGFERRLDVIEYLTMAAALGLDPIPAIKAAWREVRASSE